VSLDLLPHVAPLMRAPIHLTTTAISPRALRVGLTVIRTSCPSAVRNSISPPTEKLPARLRISVETCGCLMPKHLIHQTKDIIHSAYKLRER
jgi:hypothetical protein